MQISIAKWLSVFETTVGVPASRRGRFQACSAVVYEAHESGIV